MTIQYNRNTSHLSSNFSVPIPTTLKVTPDINPPLTCVPLHPFLPLFLTTSIPQKNYDDKAKYMPPPPPNTKKEKKKKKREGNKVRVCPCFPLKSSPLNIHCSLLFFDISPLDLSLQGKLCRSRGKVAMFRSRIHL